MEESSYSKKTAKWRLFFLILGLALFALLVFRLDPATLWKYLQKVGPRFLWILALAGLWYGFYALAWELFLKKLSRQVSLWEVFKIKVAGEAINSVTPLSWGGGDPMRILMLKEHISFPEGAASVVVDRTLNNLALALFMILGVALACFTLPQPASWAGGLVAVLVLIVFVSVFVFVRSHQGLFQFAIDTLKFFRLKKNFSEKTLRHVAEIDGHISRFYRLNRKAFSLSFLFHFLGRLCAVAEIYLAARFLEFPLGLRDSYLLGSLTVIVNLVFVFIPGSLGVMEGAFAGVFALLNLDPAIGTSLQIIRRLRMLIWTAVGFFFMSRMNRKVPR